MSAGPLRVRLGGRFGRRISRRGPAVGRFGGNAGVGDGSHVDDRSVAALPRRRPVAVRQRGEGGPDGSRHPGPRRDGLRADGPPPREPGPRGRAAFRAAGSARGRGGDAGRAGRRGPAGAPRPAARVGGRIVAAKTFGLRRPRGVRGRRNRTLLAAGRRDASRPCTGCRGRAGRFPWSRTWPSPPSCWPSSWCGRKTC